MCIIDVVVIGHALCDVSPKADSDDFFAFFFFFFNDTATTEIYTE